MRDMTRIPGGWHVSSISLRRSRINRSRPPAVRRGFRTREPLLRGATRKKWPERPSLSINPPQLCKNSAPCRRKKRHAALAGQKQHTAPAGKSDAPSLPGTKETSCWKTPKDARKKAPRSTRRTTDAPSKRRDDRKKTPGARIGKAQENPPENAPKNTPVGKKPEGERHSKKTRRKWRPVKERRKNARTRG